MRLKSSSNVPGAAWSKVASLTCLMVDCWLASPHHLSCSSRLARASPPGCFRVPREQEGSYKTAWDWGSEVTQLLTLHFTGQTSYKNSPDLGSREIDTYWQEELEIHTIKGCTYKDERTLWPLSTLSYHPIWENECGAHLVLWAFRDGRNHWGDKDELLTGSWGTCSMEQTQRNVENFRQGSTE